VRAFLPRDPLAPAGELTFVPFDSDLKLKEVILGYKCMAKALDVTTKLMDYQRSSVNMAPEAQQQARGDS
jgi:hypothetical protein